VYMLSGWVDLEFEDGQKLRIPVGRVALHPGRPAAQRDGRIKRP